MWKLYSCFALSISFFHREQKISMRSDSKKTIFVLLWSVFQKELQDILCLVGFLKPFSHCLLSSSHFRLHLPLNLFGICWTKYILRVGFVIFIQIVKNSWTGTGMTTGSDLLPLASFSCISQPLRSKTSKKLGSGVVTVPHYYTRPYGHAVS